MLTYKLTFFVEPLGYQPVEFLDIPPMTASDEPTPARVVDGVQPEVRSEASTDRVGDVE